jgi:hypothetical protein
MAARSLLPGELDKLLTAKKNDSGSVTLAYLRGEKAIEVPDERVAKRTRAGSRSKAGMRLISTTSRQRSRLAA